ncbi:ribosomal protein L18, bacterial type [Halobacteroides halobius DSM 5150]|uniref:Large ribosomal subunit protein uL18 n=1 Tax=Halobacteroides halobius (strain ATCC 35273 / DSM 5150 / MD-1) TaxID=748449 RepID=L0K4L6_HALHC|nr:50S ribosomal protein L18 [Halobacteroides halobius]AGB40217.1 ribosomal protein L18, bacterial type [Halobacteroides halobius DSM 5150]
MSKLSKEEARKRRHKRVRKTVKGTPTQPRISVHKSLNHIYAQVIDDFREKTLVSASTVDTEIREKIENGGNVEAAKVVGENLAKRALDAGIKKVVFDRSGYKYHGRIKALADAAREGGLEF